LSTLIAPLTNATKGVKKGPISLSTEALHAFDVVKQAVLDAQALQWPTDTDLFILYVDASDIGIGAMLVQLQSSGEVPISFFSKKFSDVAKRWSTIEKECFALFAAVIFLQSHLLGTTFFIRTDHKNLVHMHSSIVPKVIRWRLRLLEFNFIVLHIPGDDNVVADTLSRAFSHRGVVLEDIQDDEKAARLSSVHNEIVGHHGITRTVEMLKAAKLEWPGVTKDVTKFINECLICQKIKTSRNLFKGDSEFHLHGSYPMESLSCDTIGPLPEDDLGNKYIVAIVDNFSKFVTLYATTSTQAQDFVQSLVHHVGLFGIPKKLRTDGGSQFTAKICNELSQILKYEHLIIVPYHPQANGLVERRNAEVMKHLRALVLSRHISENWSSVLPLVQRILNFTKDGSINLCPAQVIFGDMIPMDASIIMSSSDGVIPTSDYLEMLKVKQLRLIQESQRYLEENAVTREGKGNLIIDYPLFDVGDYVLLSYPSRPPSKLAGIYRGPLVIHRRIRKDLYEVRDLISDKVSEVHISRLHALKVPNTATDADILSLAGLDHDEFLVEAIVDHRKIGNKKTDYEFLVRWQGYEPSEDTWEPYSNVKDLAALDLYLTTHPEVKLD